MHVDDVDLAYVRSNLMQFVQIYEAIIELIKSRFDQKHNIMRFSIASQNIIVQQVIKIS